MAAGSIERIQIVLQSLTSGFSKGFDRAQKTLASAGRNVQDFGKVMKQPLQNFRQLNGSFSMMKTTGGRLAYGFRNLTHGMRGFRMEMLGVMFFGMMMQRMFMNMLQPVMDAYGVFDLFRIMLLTLFLPVMDMLFPYLLAVMEWFMNLPEPVKKVIGVITIIGLVLGTLLMVIGSMALGIGSLISAFPILGSVIEVVGGILAGFGSTAALVIAAVVLLVYGLVLAWKENFLGMKGIVSSFVDAVKNIFGGLFEVLVGLVKFFTALFRGDFEGVKDAVVQISIGMSRIITGIIIAMVTAIAAILIGIVRAVWGVVKTIIGFFQWAASSIVDIFHKMGSGMIGRMIDGIRSMGRKVIDAILSLFPSWMRSGIEKSGTITLNIVQKVKEVFSGGSSKSNGSKNDFIWRPGQGAISINPNDTLVGFKGAPPNLGGGGAAPAGNITNNFYGFTMDDLKRELDNRDRRMVDDIRRLVKQ